MIKLDTKSKKLLLLQRNELLSNIQIWLRKKFGRLIFTNFFIHFFQISKIESKTEELFQKEIETFKKFLPNNPKNVMDIGCGLGIINIFLNKNYQKKINFYLLDKDKVDKKIQYGFHSNYESYNDLSITRKILEKNGIDNNEINIFDVEKPITIKEPIDLIISLKSMGYHYPFEKYLDSFKGWCSNECIFIFDIAANKYDDLYFFKYFKNIEIIYEEKSIHPLKRLICKNFIK